MKTDPKPTILRHRVTLAVVILCDSYTLFQCQSAYSSLEILFSDTEGYGYGLSAACTIYGVFAWCFLLSDLIEKSRNLKVKDLPINSIRHTNRHRLIQASFHLFFLFIYPFSKAMVIVDSLDGRATDAMRKALREKKLGPYFFGLPTVSLEN